jgi:signal peptidase I
MNDGPTIDEQPLSPPAVTGPPAGPHHRRGVLAMVQWLIATLVIAIFAITFALQAFQIPSESMEDTLLIGDYLLVDKIHFAHPGIWGRIEPYAPIRRGDIIVFRYPVNPSEHFVKRVIGVPGDHIRLVNKQVVVNDKPLREDYVIHREPKADGFRDNFPSGSSITSDVDLRWWQQMRRFVHNGELVVPSGHYFVLGDNRDQSLDSRYWGFVPRENIVGRPLVIYWSLRATDKIDGMPPATESSTGKSVSMLYTLSHLFQQTRWDRTLRLVN